MATEEVVFILERTVCSVSSLFDFLFGEASDWRTRKMDENSGCLVCRGRSVNVSLPSRNFCDFALK